MQRGKGVAGKRADFSEAEKRRFFLGLQREDLKTNWRELEGEKKWRDQLKKFEGENETHILFLEEPPSA